MKINDLKKNFVIFPLNSDIVEHGKFNDVLENEYLKGFLKFNELLTGTYFRGVPIIGKNDIDDDVEILLLQKNNSYILDNIEQFLSFKKETYFFDDRGFLTKVRSEEEIIAKNQKPIVSFVLFYDYYTLSRFSIQMKEKYFCIAFIDNKLKDMQIDESYFDFVVYFQNDDALMQHLKKVNSQYIFTKGLIGHYHRIARLTDLFDNVVADSTDIPHFFTDNQQKNEFFFGGTGEFRAVEKICTQAKKFLIRYSDDEYDFLQSFSKKKNLKTWYEYTNKDFFVKKKKEITKPYSLVWAGILQPLSYPAYFVGKDLLNSAKAAAKQNIEFTFMLPPSFSSSMLMIESDRKLYYEFFYEAKFNKNITIHFGDVPKRVIKLLQNYHYGVFPLYQYERKFTKNMIPSKFALYLEAGLPIIVNKKMKRLSEVVERHNLGITINEQDIENLREILTGNENKYSQMQESIFEFREKFSYETKIKELMEEL